MRHQYELSRADKDGNTERDHIEAALGRARTEERRAELEAELDGPALPIELAHLWDAFRRLSDRRGSTGFGSAPITWPDIDAFVRLTREALSSWDCEVIERLDGVFLSVQAEKVKGGGAEG